MTLSDAAAHQDITTVEVPTHWYNLAAELDTPIPPHLHPGTKEPVGPDDLAALVAADVLEGDDALVGAGLPVSCVQGLPK